MLVIILEAGTSAVKQSHNFRQHYLSLMPGGIVAVKTHFHEQLRIIFLNDVIINVFEMNESRS